MPSGGSPASSPSLSTSTSCSRQCGRRSSGVPRKDLARDQPAWSPVAPELRTSVLCPGEADTGGTQMTDQQLPEQSQNPVKDPDDWTTGGEPMTGPQASYLQTLLQQAGKE